MINAVCEHLQTTYCLILISYPLDDDAVKRSINKPHLCADGLPDLAGSGAGCLPVAVAVAVCISEPKQVCCEP